MKKNLFENLISYGKVKLVGMYYLLPIFAKRIEREWPQVHLHNWPLHAAHTGIRYTF